ncbi:MAG: hypothetical protein U0174_04840 [Polyangiaceae bacterium]
MKRPSLLVACLVPMTLGAFLACGSRGPLDDFTTIEVVKDSSTNTVDSEVFIDATPTVDASTKDVRDAADERSQIDKVIDCAQCLNNNCGDKFTSCFANAACRDTFQCAITQCLSGGQPDLGCVLNCANGDLGQLAAILGVVQCPLTKCKTDCPDLLSLLGGLGGGGGGGGGGTPPPPPPPPPSVSLGARAADERPDELVCERARASLRSWPTFSAAVCKQR